MLWGSVAVEFEDEVEGTPGVVSSLYVRVALGRIDVAIGCAPRLMRTSRRVTAD